MFIEIPVEYLGVGLSSLKCQHGMNHLPTFSDHMLEESVSINPGIPLLSAYINGVRPKLSGLP